MTLDVELKGKYLFKKVRALFDCGSQRSYVLKSTAKELGLEPMDTENIGHLLFGGSRTEPSLHNKYNIELRGAGRTLMVPLKFEFLDQEIICGDIPRLPKVPLLKELKKYKIWLSDVGPGSPKIEILIGSDIYGKLLTGHVQQLSGGLTAIQTKLGWTVCGKEDNHMNHDINTSRVFLTSLAVREFNISDLWKLDTIGIMDPGESLTKASEDEFAQEQFLQSLNREEDGRYCVGLPWLGNQKDIPSNRHIAEKRLFSVTRRLKSINKFEDYNQVFQEWLEEGVIEKVPEPELEAKGHYLPHHPIIKADSVTTKIRPVFDASCKVDRMPSLNECLVKGPNLIEEIPAILLRFREKKIGVVSDIRRAFLQISLQKEDRDHLRFLWWESLHKVQTFRHNRVVFGVTCSPFLLGAVIQYHLSKVPEELKPTAEKLLKSFYVDNCVTSVDSETELNYFVTKATEILAEAKMDLRMWEFRPLEKSHIPTQFVASDDIGEEFPVLGLRWDKTDDSLMFSYKFETRTKNPTKRDILSLTQGIFDPIRVLTPVLLPAKLLIQQAWAEKVNWDSPLPKDIEKNFIRWYESLYVLTDFRFPRRIGFGENFNWSLQVFCDASQSAYATVIFLRCANDVISVKLVGARSRLSPLKRMTIPRLELMACILGARLAKFIAEALSLSNVVICYWTDSTTALAWIQRNDQWGTFVGNRVREICKLTNPDQWSYVSGTKNPADLPSRGCSSRQFLERRWWEGPDWLKSNEEDWESMENAPDEEIVALERRKGTTVNLIGKVESTKWYERISKFSRIVRVLAWVRRFIKNTQLKNVSKEENLSVEETQDSENALWKIVQKESFSDSDNAIKGLLVMRDADGLIRVKTKIIEREDTFSFRYPILLPGKHHVITSLITEYHKQNCHAGVQILSAKLRETYWIIASRRNIRNVVTRCVTCKRFSAKSQTTPPIHLPLDRVRDASVFEIVGIDLCGPLYLKNKNKTWIVLFTCAVYRAVHLELTMSLSTEAFIHSLRRFIARRGRPSTIYSDNGTNFVGTKNALQEIDWQKIISNESLCPIKWKFIPPTAAWWGGWWERLVRTVKTLMVRVLGRSSLTYEELATVLCDVESSINSRPLTYISDASEDLVALTPDMFLHDLKEIGVPDLDAVDQKKLQIRSSYCQKLREEIRSRFRKEYLGQLVQRLTVKGDSLQVGDVVLVGLEHQKRLNWPMAKVLKIYPSRDGQPRVAKVKLKGGTLIRPLQKLYPLEISSSADPVFHSKKKKSRFRRTIKPPEKLDL